MKKKIAIISGVVGALLVLWLLWCLLASPTRIALLNFQNFQVAKMVRSAGNSFVKVDALGVDEVSKLKKYDAVLVFAMGLRVTEEDRAEMQRLANKGVPFYSFAVTSPDFREECESRGWTWLERKGARVGDANADEIERIVREMCA